MKGLQRLWALTIIFLLPLVAMAEHGGPATESDGDSGGYTASPGAAPEASGSSDAILGASTPQEEAVYEHLLRQWESDNNSRLLANSGKSTVQPSQIMITKRVVTQTSPTVVKSQSQLPSPTSQGASRNSPVASGTVVSGSPANITVNPPNVTVIANVVPLPVSQPPSQDATPKDGKDKEETKNAKPQEISAINLIWPEPGRDTETGRPNAILTGAPSARSFKLPTASESSRWERLAKRMWSFLGAKSSSNDTQMLAAVPVQGGIQVPIENVPDATPGRLVSTAPSNPESLWIPIAGIGWLLTALLSLWVRRLQTRLKRRY